MKTKVLIYCTKSNDKLIRCKDNFEILNFTSDMIMKDHNTGKELNINDFSCNGKIVAECEVEVEEMYTDENGMSYYTDTIKEAYTVSKCACLDDSDIYGYLGNNIGYALHISNLKVFDKPMELSELQRNKECPFDCPYICGSENCKLYSSVRQAPKNMMWAWYKVEKYCLISIRPECVCKILNGDKDIEIRKKVLKEML